MTGSSTGEPFGSSTIPLMFASPPEVCVDLVIWARAAGEQSATNRKSKARSFILKKKNGRAASDSPAVVGENKSELQANTELERATRHFDVRVLRKARIRNAGILDKEVGEVTGAVNAIARIRVIEEVVSLSP